MKKGRRWKGYLLLLIILALISAYGMRVAYVNRENDKTQIHYLPDDAPVEVQGLEISIEEERLYEIAAFVDAFPSVQTNYRYQGSMYEQMQDEEGLRSTEYILYVRMNFKNLTEELLPVPHLEYKLYAGKSYENGVNPFLVENLNKASGLSLRPGSSYSFLLAYELNRKSFREEKYRKLSEQDFSIVVSGYPQIRHIRLSHLELVQADKKAEDVYENLVSADKAKAPALPDTKKGTILEMGESYVQRGVIMTLESVHIVDNLNDFDYQSLGEAEDNGTPDITHYARKDGSLWEGSERLYAVFVTLRYQNKNDIDIGFSISPALYNEKGQGQIGYRYEWLGEQFSHEKYSAAYILAAGADDTATVVYLIDGQMAKKTWGSFDKPLYIDCGGNGMVPKGIDLQNGNPGDGIFMRIQ